MSRKGYFWIGMLAGATAMALLTTIAMAMS